MCFKLDAREVLLYLNELGYTNINGTQLKEFMTDLKRLLKYEEHIEQVDENDYTSKSPRRDVFTELYNHETVASKAKKSVSTSNNHKEHVITVEIKRDPKSAPCNKNKSTVTYSTSPRGSSVSKCQSCPDSLSNVAVTSSVPTLTTSKSTSSLPVTARTTSSSLNDAKKSTKLRTNSSKSSFIRPRFVSKPKKCDPVALYHQYKEEWKKIKFPGEHNHNETRWAVREKLLGDS